MPLTSCHGTTNLKRFIGEGEIAKSTKGSKSEIPSVENFRQLSETVDVF